MAGGEGSAAWSGSFYRIEGLLQNGRFLLQNISYRIFLFPDFLNWMYESLWNFFSAIGCIGLFEISKRPIHPIAKRVPENLEIISICSTYRSDVSFQIK